MPKLQKKQATLEAEFGAPDQNHSKEFCHHHGTKTWVKRRHLKRMEQTEAEYPIYDMDGAPFDPYRGHSVYGESANL